ncbi:hypothetical protein QNN00_22035 [Bacillus velezensis]|nr:hypothetical protein [Bacillus velezensis]
MPYPSISKAKQASFEAMHCLTIALLHILSVTVDKRRGSNYKEEIRLFSALCRWQMETGGRLFLMISLEEEQKQMYERHFLEMKTVTERTKNSFLKKARANSGRIRLRSGLSGGFRNGIRKLPNLPSDGCVLSSSR